MQLWALFGEQTPRADLPLDHPDYQPGNSEDVAAWANAYRARKGLPPVAVV